MLVPPYGESSPSAQTKRSLWRGRMSGYSVHADETRATIVSDVLRLGGIGGEVIQAMSFDHGADRQRIVNCLTGSLAVTFWPSETDSSLFVFVFP